MRASARAVVGASPHTCSQLLTLPTPETMKTAAKMAPPSM
jgi:hypothetical protein